MSMRMVCDRCGRVKDKVDIFAHVTYKHGIGKDVIDEYDICAACAEQFERFMNGCEVEEEDPYKDSKPCDVVIHKLANGHYVIENVPDGEKKNHCGTCLYQWCDTKCPRAKETPGTISCENDAECCDKWTPAVESSIDKEESDLSVPISKSSSGVYMPEGKPWTTKKHNREDCSNCEYSTDGDGIVEYGPCPGSDIHHSADCM